MKVRICLTIAIHIEAANRTSLLPARVITIITIMIIAIALMGTAIPTALLTRRSLRPSAGYGPSSGRSRHVEGVEDVSEVRVRWLGHRLHAELNIAVRPELSVEQGHDIANKVRHELLHELRYLSNATIHIDPSNASGEKHHHIAEHAHDGLPVHSH